MPVDPARARALIDAHTHGWNDEQRAALLTRLRQEATRRDIARTHHTAGALARHCDPQTVQTPALDVIDAALEQALSTPNARVVISVPPQEGKSTRVSVWGTIRALVQDPDRRIVLASYSDALARTHARTARNMVRDHGSDAHDPLTGLPLPDKLGIALAEDKSAAGNWKLRGHRGGLYSCGVGGSMTGQPADMVIIDDPLKDMQAADSALERQKVIDWWEAVVQTRLAPGAPVIIVQTRWHEEDLAGHVLTQDEPLPEAERRWRLVNIPAISEAGVPDALGRPPGVAMVSARGRTQADFERTKDAVGPRVWSALYQGAPTPSGGGLFSQEWFDRYRIPTVDAAVVRIVSIDPAETGRRDEAGLIAAAATADGRVVWTDDWSGRMQSDQWARRAILLALSTGATELLFEAYTTEQTYERILKQAWRDIRDQARLLRTHGAASAAAVLAAAEDGPATPADAAVLLAELDGITVPDQTDMPLRIHPGRWKGDKIARATGARQAASTGRLRIAGTLPVLEKQAVHWQQGQHSPDRMDAAVNAYNRLCELIGAETVIASPTSVAQRAAAISGVGRTRRGGAAALLGRSLPTNSNA